MIKKKKIAVMAAASVMAISLCIGTTSVFAANNGGVKKNVSAPGVTAKTQNTKPVVKRAQTHDDLAVIAAEVGINIDGMTDKQIEAALVSYKLSHQGNANTPKDLQEIAKKMNIDTTGITHEQIKSAIAEKGKMAGEKK